MNHNTKRAARLTAIWGDEALLDEVGGAATAGHAEPVDRLVELLLAWRSQADSEPVGDLVDTDLAMAVIGAGRREAR